MSNGRITLRFVLKTTIAIGLITLFAVYVLYQGRFVLAGPVIRLYNEPASTTYENNVQISGNVRNAAAIKLNGGDIVTTKDGDFKEKVWLQNGYNIITISANDRYGRRSYIEREFIYIEDNE
tara:strand:+ start:185 stop:550 length:366 start_codon:yes stop_codon:yes gene_type:complete